MAVGEFVKMPFDLVKSNRHSFSPVPSGKTAVGPEHFQHSAGHTSTSLLFILGPLRRLPWFIFLWGLVNTAQMFQRFFHRKCGVKPPGWKTRETKKVKARGDISGLRILDKYTVWRTVLSAGVDTAWQPFNSNTDLGARQSHTLESFASRCDI